MVDGWLEICAAVAGELWVIAAEAEREEPGYGRQTSQYQAELLGGAGIEFELRWLSVGEESFILLADWAAAVAP